jgi:hypothetical protein
MDLLQQHAHKAALTNSKHIYCVLLHGNGD